MKKKQIGLFFGSFNPVHLGHIRLADYIYSHADFDEIWYVVSPCNPLKKRSNLIDENKRLYMIQLCIADKPYLKACDAEFSLPQPSFTITTLQYLSKKKPLFEFTLFIGSDNAQIFDKWKDYDKILTDYKVLVYPRKGYHISLQILEKFPQMQVLFSAPTFDISSTQIRQMIMKNIFSTEWLHPQVIQYLRKNRLYQ